MACLLIEPIPRDCYPGELLRFVASIGPIEGKKVGKISLLGRLAQVEIPDGEAARLLKTLDGAELRGRPVRVRLQRSRQASQSGGFFGQLSRLLDLEAEAEREQLRCEAQSSTLAEGRCLTRLQLLEEEAGLGGRWILTFQGQHRGELPPNRLQPGSPVVVSELSDRRGISFRAIVSDRQEQRISVAIETEPEDWPEEKLWRIDLSPDEVSRQRQQAALVRVETAENDRLSELRDLTLGEAEPRFAEPERTLIVGLNEYQRAAVQWALAAEDIALIHGPPGTGKTTTVVEFIRLAVARGERLLACAPSNAAVDNLLEKLLSVGVEPVRLGHPARVQENLRNRALDLVVQDHPDARTARKMVREASKLFRQAERWTRGKPQPGEKQSYRQEARQLLKDARQLEQIALDRVLDEAPVLCATLTGVDSETLGQRRFDWVVIDEACQATEPACWIPLLRGEKVLLAGDPCQLPPTILSDAAAEQGLGVSLMERQLAQHGPSIARLLQIQYRMHSRIMSFSSVEFYGGELMADDSVAQHTLAELPNILPEEITEQPILFLDTAGAGLDEAVEEDTGSRRNVGEADWVIRAVEKLRQCGVTTEQIGIITPYSGQVRHLRERLRGTGLEVDSVDGFQGREKEAIIVSWVRSNPAGEIGFLADLRRSNVALTRARRKLIVIGDSATLSQHPYYQRMLEYFESIGAYRSVWDEPF